jgi:hypothetical protein
MYESDHTLGLDAETRERMRAVFEGHTCCRCGAPADRLSADRFFCGIHVPGKLKEPARPPRVYRCAVGLPN